MVAERRAASLPFVIAGIACVVAGGFVAAATAPSPTEHGTWAAAYLVLVAGVAQAALGLGQARLAPAAPRRDLLIAQFVCWNLGNAAVIAGTVSDVVAVVDVGGALLVVALGLLVLGVRRPAASAPSALPRPGASGAVGWLLPAYRVLLVALLISIGVGLFLARVPST